MKDAYESDSSEEIEIEDKNKKFYICGSCQKKKSKFLPLECRLDESGRYYEENFGFHKNCGGKVDKHYTKDKIDVTNWESDHGYPYPYSTDEYNFCGLFCRKDRGKGSQEHYTREEMSERAINDWEIDKGYPYSGETVFYYSTGNFSPNDELKNSDLILCETCGENKAIYYDYETKRIKKKNKNIK